MTRRTLWCVVGLLAVLLALGCGAPSAADAGTDAGASSADAGAPHVDAGAPHVDAGQPDAGPGPVDAGGPDAGLPDAGSPDAGPVDAGSIDSGAVDSGAPDAGVGDAGPACLLDGDCPGVASDCRRPRCVLGACTTELKAVATPTPGQIPGDCQALVCDGDGGVVTAVDNADVPAVPGQCFLASCSAGTPATQPAPLDTPCTEDGGVVCTSGGVCVQCTGSGPAQCTGGLVCLANHCAAASCGDGMKNGAETDADCGGSVCAACVAGKQCLLQRDCQSQLCLNHVCQPPSCTDGVRNGTETGVDCGGSCAACATVLLLAGNLTDTLAAEFHPGSTWATASLAAPTTDAPALTLLAQGSGVGLVRYTSLGSGSDQHLQVSAWARVSGWSPVADLAAGLTTRAAPSVASASGSAQVVYQGLDYKYYFARLTGGVWAPTAEPVGTTSSQAQSYGPTPAALAAPGGVATVAFFDGAALNALTVQDRDGGTWSPKHSPGSPAGFTNSPVLIPLSGGAADLLLASIAPDGSLHARTRTGGTWSADVVIPNASTENTSRLALTSLPAGGALLAFRGQDTNLYLSTFSGGAWSASPSPFTTTPTSIVSPPALAPGVGTATAELAFIRTSDGVAYHARLVGSAWTAPVAVGGSALLNVSLASAP